MFITVQDESKKEYYYKMLQAVGSLSRLFSDSPQPYLYYRVAENLFCKSFEAENLSRSDVSADAALNSIGIGLKTFLKGSGRKMEKVAEFNSDSPSFRILPPEQQITEIARLRNTRIETTKSIYGLDDMIYHSVVRENGKMGIIEESMNTIDLASINIISVNDKSLKFSDIHNEYSFNISKSTLMKRFVVNNILMEVPIEILNDPFVLLEDLLQHEKDLGLVFRPISESEDHVFLPLYSIRDGKEVPEKSGLNQWNAAGRIRNLNEVYMPVPAWIHQKFVSFFPDRNTEFNLQLPDKRILSAKICQEGGKALMTNPNDALGQWILRDVLKLEEGELLTYKKLQDIGLDAVVVYKINEGNYRIDFAKIGSYDKFKTRMDLSGD